ATNASVDAILGVTETIGRVNETAAAIASAVEQQAAATQEIARNVQQAAQGTHEVSSNISAVSQVAQATGNIAGELRAARDAPGRSGELLKQQVDRFLRVVRTAQRRPRCAGSGRQPHLDRDAPRIAPDPGHPPAVSPALRAMGKSPLRQVAPGLVARLVATIDGGRTGHDTLLDQALAVDFS